MFYLPREIDLNFLDKNKKIYSTVSEMTWWIFIKIMSEGLNSPPSELNPSAKKHSGPLCIYDIFNSRHN